MATYAISRADGRVDVAAHAGGSGGAGVQAVRAKVHKHPCGCGDATACDPPGIKAAWLEMAGGQCCVAGARDSTALPRTCAVGQGRTAVVTGCAAVRGGCGAL